MSLSPHPPTFGLTTAGTFQEWVDWISKTPPSEVGPPAIENVITFVLIGNQNTEAWFAHGFFNGLAGPKLVDSRLANGVLIGKSLKDLSGSASLSFTKRTRSTGIIGG